MSSYYTNKKCCFCHIPLAFSIKDACQTCFKKLEKEQRAPRLCNYFTAKDLIQEIKRLNLIDYVNNLRALTIQKLSS